MDNNAPETAGNAPERMVRSYSAQLRTTRRQNAKLQGLLAHLCELYNAALQERRDAWKTCQKSVRYYEQQAELKELRALDAETASFSSAIQRDPLRRVQRAFDGFFRRIKAHQEPGYPRFRSQECYDSFSVDAQNFQMKAGRIFIAKIGGFRFHTRYEIKGSPKTLHVRRYGNKWRATIVCDIGRIPEKLPVSQAIGIDVGLTTLATLSDGIEIENPRWTKQAEESLASGNRRLATKKRGSNNRLKAVVRLQRIHARIQGRRRAYLHAVSRWLVSNYDLIAFEKLAIHELAQKGYAKSIMDAAWGELIWQLTYKAEWAGKWAVPVNARGTTQLCSQCGEKVPKTLRQRLHDCPKCGLALGRDHNAALNVLQRGLRCAGTPAGVQS